MGRRARGQGAGIEPAYEGEEALSALLARAGSPYTAGEVEARFREAQARGDGRDRAIPALFPAEPRFGSPDEARRLYANLFGLWERVRAGPAARNGGPPPPAPRADAPSLPPRGAEPGPEVPAAVVEAAWRHLDALPARERQRQRHRYEAAQPDLAAWVAALPLADVAAVAAQDLAFELWTMLDLAFGDRVRTARYADLRALEAAAPPPLAEGQPALAAYVDEVLDLVEEESAGLPPTDRVAVQRAMATAVEALESSKG
jgi:hypothetical protein